ncbi:MAG: Uma2 family endonuclease [Candidatus Poribacteria bacterium]|nr:Uma2 family endonuclease [Candidatus Poribacteria bacterium]
MASDKSKKPIQYAPTDDDGIYYPESDGKPLAETDLHRIVIVNTYQKLEAYYEDRDDVYVSGNLLIYDVPGKTRRSISPDVMVVFGIEKKMRRTYKIWEEGKAPDFVMEVTSKSTYKNDLRKKKTRYAHMGVREYFLYDPERSYLPDSLIGFRLNDDGKYDAISTLSSGGIPSATLGIEFRLQEDDIGLHDMTSSEWLQTPAEKAEAEVRCLRAEIERLKKA